MRHLYLGCYISIQKLECYISAQSAICRIPGSSLLTLDSLSVMFFETVASSFCELFHLCIWVPITVCESQVSKASLDN